MIRLCGLALGFLLVALPWLGQPVGAQGVTCSSFPSQAAAQAAYRNDPAGLANLDADGDGIACESNGAPFDQTPVSRPAAPAAQPAQPSAPAPTAQQTQSGPRPPTPGPAGTV